MFTCKTLGICLRYLIALLLYTVPCYQNEFQWIFRIDYCCCSWPFWHSQRPPTVDLLFKDKVCMDWNLVLDTNNWYIIIQRISWQELSLWILVHLYWDNNNFVTNSHSSILCSSWLMWAPQDSVRYFRMYLVDSVFPAPDSPDTMMDWLILLTFMSRNALSAEMSRATHLHYHSDTYFSISTCSSSLIQ